MGEGPADSAGPIRGRGTSAPPAQRRQPTTRWRTIYARYEAERTRRRLLDFDDLIVACADALAGDSEFADSIRWRSRHLFVDEMQDVNPAQFRLLTALLSDDPDLFVVGDPNQSVYGFNGADPTLLDRLPEILRGTKIIRLDENHRCTPQVVAVATEVLRDAGGAAAARWCRPARPGSTEPVPRVVSHATDDDEAAWAARQAKLSRLPGRRWSSIAVLTRTNAQLTEGARRHGGCGGARRRGRSGPGPGKRPTGRSLPPRRGERSSLWRAAASTVAPALPLPSSMTTRWLKQYPVTAWSSPRSTGPRDCSGRPSSCSG